MKIKTFYAKSMAEALRNAKEDFGPEALILSSKERQLRSAFGLRGKTVVEVVAATEADYPCTEAGGLTYQQAAARPSVDCRAPADPVEAEPAAGLSTCAPPAFPRTRLPRQDFPKDGREFNEMRRMLCTSAKAAPLAPAMFPDTAAFELYQDLVANEINEWLAYRLLDEAERKLPVEQPRQRTTLMRSVTEAARGLLPDMAGPEGVPGRRLVAFVGPTGVGKTTAVAKVAARLAFAKKKNVMLVTTDTYRVGAVHQLRTYAALMGLPFGAVDPVAELPRFIGECSQRDFILIDTAGYGQKNLEPVRDLLLFLQKTPDIERHLVISATTKPADMQEISDRFEVCAPDRLLFTKLDETSTYGPLFNELVRTQKPLSYFSDGPRVPEDLHPAVKDQIIDMLLSTH